MGLFTLFLDNAICWKPFPVLVHVGFGAIGDQLKNAQLLVFSTITYSLGLFESQVFTANPC